MTQLLAGGVIVLGILILAFTIFVAARKKKPTTIQVKDTPSQTQTQTHQGTQATPLAEGKPTVAQAEPVTSEAQAQTVAVATHPLMESSTEESTTASPSMSNSREVAPIASTMLANGIDQSPLWWREQLQSLTSQLQYLREHARDVERQIAILGEIAALVTELEMLQKKREISPEGKISIFPLNVHRQPTELSYTTDKRPAVRKYTIEALS